MWKIQLTITINFISSEDNNDDEQRLMHSKNDNKEIMIINKSDEVVEKMF